MAGRRALLEPILQTAQDGAPVPNSADPPTERVLDAALARFEDFGIQRTTMEDVARHAGVSRVTIYRRFPRKERLVEAVILREGQRLFAPLGAARARPRAGEERGG